MSHNNNNIKKANNAKLAKSDGNAKTTIKTTAGNQTRKANSLHYHQIPITTTKKATKMNLLVVDTLSAYALLLGDEEKTAKN